MSATQTTHRYFGSGTSQPYNHLSNFHECRVEGSVFVKTAEETFEEMVFVFPCAEHYWWAHFMHRPRDIQRLAIGGDLSTVDGLKILLGDGIGAIKARYWGRRGNVGIVSKMLATRKGNKRFRAVNAGIDMSTHPLEKYGEQGKSSTLVDIWKKILVAKYTQNKGHRAVLLSTGSDNLVEFARMHPEKQFWAGQVVDGGVKHAGGRVVGGEVSGNNFVGKCMMATRSHLYARNY